MTLAFNYIPVLKIIIFEVFRLHLKFRFSVARMLQNSGNE